jgi:predicted DCC family thiol-disulfide oxidoreductase YuxK
MPQDQPPVVLYDCECAACDASVQFILDHDPDAQFRFASLQSQSGQSLAAASGLDAADLSTLILITAEGARVRSDAVIEIARRLGLPKPLVKGFLIIPRPIRDAAYGLFARNRIRLFGRLDACRILTPDTRARFLDS